MKKIVIGVVMLCMLVLTGCTNNISNFFTKFDDGLKSKGYSYVYIEDYASIKGATGGFKYTIVGDTAIHVLAFDKSSTEYKEIVETKRITISSVATGNMVYKAYINNGYVLYYESLSKNEVDINTIFDSIK